MFFNLGGLVHEVQSYLIQRPCREAHVPAGIKRLEVTEIIATGEIVASYPDDLPHPSFLLLGFTGVTPVHVVVAQNQQGYDCVVVTAYIPDNALWGDGFRKRS